MPTWTVSSTARTLSSVFQQGEYEDAIVGNSGWADGDWSGDAEFTSRDFVVAFQRGGYEQGPREQAKAVPEPASGLLNRVGPVDIECLEPREMLPQWTHPTR